MNGIPHVVLEMDNIQFDQSRMHPNDEQKPAYTRTVSLYNFLPADEGGNVGIVGREGVKFNLPPRTSMKGLACLVVRLDIIADKAVTDSIIDSMSNARDVENSLVMQVARKDWATRTAQETFYHSNRRTRIEYYVTLDLLRQYGGTIYLKDVDLVVSLNGKDSIISHPYCRSGDMHWGADSILTPVEEDADCGQLRNNNNFIAAVKIIDNAGAIGPRWIRINDEVHVIRPMIDPEHQDGFYVTRSSPVISEIATSQMLSHLYSADDQVEGIRLYRSYLEAKNDGVTPEVMKLRLQESEHQARQLDADTKLMQAQTNYDRVRAEAENLRTTINANQQKHQYEKELLERKIEELKEEQKNLVLKEKTEKNSTRRKGFLEIVKSIPAMITAVLTLAMTLGRVLRFV